MRGWPNVTLNFAKTRYDKKDLLLPFNSSLHPLSAEYHEAYVWGQNVAQIILNYAHFPLCDLTGQDRS